MRQQKPTKIHTLRARVPLAEATCGCERPGGWLAARRACSSRKMSQQTRRRVRGPRRRVRDGRMRPPPCRARAPTRRRSTRGKRKEICLKARRKTRSRAGWRRGGGRGERGYAGPTGQQVCAGAQRDRRRGRPAASASNRKCCRGRHRGGRRAGRPGEKKPSDNEAQGADRRPRAAPPAPAAPPARVGEDTIAAGRAGRRLAVRGSPVAPRSAAGWRSSAGRGAPGPRDVWDIETEHTGGGGGLRRPRT